MEFRSWHCGRQAGGSFKLDFRPWHGGRQGENLNKELEFRSGIVEGKGELKSSILDHAIVEGKSGTINKELDFRSLWKAREGKVHKKSDFRSKF